MNFPASRRLALVLVASLCAAGLSAAARSMLSFVGWWVGWDVSNR